MVAQPLTKKNQSSPSKMFKQFNPNQQSSKSPYRNIRDSSEPSSIGPRTQSSYQQIKSGQQASINISPMKVTSKYGMDKQSDMMVNGGSSIQNVHQRLREYQGNQGHTSVSKSLFQSDKLNSPHKLQTKTASTFG